jgi:hypothetical protein
LPHPFVGIYYTQYTPIKSLVRISLSFIVN